MASDFQNFRHARFSIHEEHLVSEKLALSHLYPIQDNDFDATFRFG